MKLASIGEIYLQYEVQICSLFSKIGSGNVSSRHCLVDVCWG